MKKQIFILVLTLLGISFSSVYGQKAVKGSAPNATAGCTDDALHPMAGKSYNYSAIVNPTGGNFIWWATKDQNFITTTGGVATNNSSTKLTVGAGLSAAGSTYGVSGVTPSVDITWSSTTLANTAYKGTGTKTPTFVVVQYDAPSAGCSNNLKVYELDPKNGFIVDILNLNNTTKSPAAYGVNESQCIDKVSKATYNAGAMVYEYGTNIFYYEVVAANFSESWKPTLVLSGLDAVQTSLIEWTYDKTLATGWQTYTAGSTTVETDATDTSTGVSIYVRVTVTNNNFEGKADETIVLALDGQNKDGEWDIKNSDCLNTSAADQDDKATQVLKARPEITGGTTSTIVTNVNLIPGNEK